MRKLMLAAVETLAADRCLQEVVVVSLTRRYVLRCAEAPWSACGRSYKVRVERDTDGAHAEVRGHAAAVAWLRAQVDVYWPEASDG